VLKSPLFWKSQFAKSGDGWEQKKLGGIRLDTVGGRTITSLEIKHRRGGGTELKHHPLLSIGEEGREGQSERTRT